MNRRLLALAVAASLAPLSLITLSAQAADPPSVLLQAAADSYRATLVHTPDQLPEREHANRMVIPAAFASAEGQPAGLAFAAGERLSRAAWPAIANLDGGVLIDGEGRIHIEHVDAFEHGGASHALRHSEEDFQALKAIMSDANGGFFQTLMWIDGGTSLLGEQPPADRHRRTSLVETADGTLMVVSSGTQLVSITDHVAHLLDLGAHDAVAVEPAGFFCWHEAADEAVSPCGPLASSYLVIDYD